MIETVTFLNFDLPYWRRIRNYRGDLLIKNTESFLLLGVVFMVSLCLATIGIFGLIFWTCSGAGMLLVTNELYQSRIAAKRLLAEAEEGLADCIDTLRHHVEFGTAFTNFVAGRGGSIEDVIQWLEENDIPVKVAIKRVAPERVPFFMFAEISNGILISFSGSSEIAEQNYILFKMKFM